MLHNEQFKSLFYLETLSLHNNSLTTITKDIFRYNTKLINIDLSYNYITIFNADLSKLTDYILLKVNNNKLKTFNEYAFKYYISSNESYKRILYIHNNTLNCNCSMYWMLELGEALKSKITYDSSCKDIADVTNNKSTNIPLQCFMDHTYLSNSTCEILNTSYCKKGVYIILDTTIYSLYIYIHVKIYLYTVNSN